MVKNNINIQKIGLISIGIIILDQLIKALVISVGNYEINSGFTFGFFQNFNITAIVLSSIVLVILVIFLFKNKNHTIIFSLIFSAGLSNIIDRIIRGGVVDYIRIGNFPVFNIADVVINLSILYLILQLLNEERSNIKSR